MAIMVSKAATWGQAQNGWVVSTSHPLQGVPMHAPPDGVPGLHVRQLPLEKGLGEEASQVGEGLVDVVCGEEDLLLRVPHYDLPRRVRCTGWCHLVIGLPWSVDQLELQAGQAHRQPVREGLGVWLHLSLLYTAPLSDRCRRWWSCRQTSG